LVENSHIRRKQNIVTYSTFVLTFIVVILSLIPVVFPALIIRLTSSYSNYTINPFEFGIWAIPFFIVNIIFFGLLIAYYKKKLPNIIRRAVTFVYNFEISPRITFAVILVLLALFIGFSISDLAREEGWADYWAGSKAAAQNWSFDNGKGIIDIKYFFLHFSLLVFKNIRIIPFITSFFLLIITYFFTVTLTKKRFSGLIAFVVLLQSNNFLTYDSTAAYSNFWVLFYLLSLYLVYKKWYLSPLSYLLSIITKGITVVFLPLSFFFIYNSDISQKKKMLLTIPYVLIIVLLITAFFMPNFLNIFPVINFNEHGFWNGFSTLPFQLSLDGLVLMSLLPVTILLFIVSKRGLFHANSIMILIAGTLLSSPLLGGFTLLTLEPYRQISVITFLAVGMGMILSKKITAQV
jgi:hypothetical protein